VQARLSRFGAVLRFVHLLNVTLMPLSAKVPTTPAGWARHDSRARLLSQAAPGAMLWAGVAGSCEDTQLDSVVFRLSSLRAVGLQEDTPSEGFCRESQCQGHNQRLSPLHRRLCPYFRTHRHNAICRILVQIIHEADAGLVRQECGSAFRARLGASGQVRAAGRADISVSHTGLSTGIAAFDRRQLLIDVCVGDPAGVRLLSWHSQGVAAAGLAAQKHIHYMTPGFAKRSHAWVRLGLLLAQPPPPAHLRPVGLAATAAAKHHALARPVPLSLWQPADCAYAYASNTLVPFAMETHGYLGADADRLLQGLATHASGGPGVGGDVAERRRLLHRWRLLLSCTLTRAVSVQAATHPGPIVSPLGVAAATQRYSSSVSTTSASGPSLGGAAAALPGSLAAAPPGCCSSPRGFC
jgi:hypothetical protein